MVDADEITQRRLKVFIKAGAFSRDEVRSAILSGYSDTRS